MTRSCNVSPICYTFCAFSLQAKYISPRESLNPLGYTGTLKVRCITLVDQYSRVDIRVYKIRVLSRSVVRNITGDVLDVPRLNLDDLSVKSVKYDRNDIISIFLFNDRYK